MQMVQQQVPLQQVTMIAPAQPMMMQAPQHICDRTSPQKGATRLQNPNFIEIKYNAQIRDVGCVFKTMEGLYTLNSADPWLASAWLQPLLKLKCDILVSKLAFKFNLYRYTLAFCGCLPCYGICAPPGSYFEQERS